MLFFIQSTVDVQNQPQNFSGDSQDSRGYTSISVREPLAALKAQTAASRGLSSTTGTNSQGSAQSGQNPLEGEGYFIQNFCFNLFLIKF